jgi:L-alanine-DL-glutamate epimerase-like enolase superfamily enzyme
VKIAGLETFTRDRIGLVRVTTEDGAHGWGQMAPGHADITARILHRQVARYFLGQEESAVESLGAQCLAGEYKYHGSYLCRDLAGVDTALWDLRGQRAGQSVCELLGGTPRALPVYASSLRRDFSPAAEVARLLRWRDEFGVRAVKVKIGGRMSREDEVAGRTEALIPAVRRGLGPDMVLLADANGSYPVARAIEVGRRLEQHGYGHYEEPCPFEELEWTAEVAAALDIPVAGGEQDGALAQFRRMVAGRAVDVLQFDVGYVGGLSRALTVAAMARAAGLAWIPHSANASLIFIFSLHLCAAVPGAGRFVEYGIEGQPGAPSFYGPRPVVRDGAVIVPAGPGWGVEIHPDWLAQAERVVSKA